MKLFFKLKPNLIYLKYAKFLGVNTTYLLMAAANPENWHWACEYSGTGILRLCRTREAFLPDSTGCVFTVMLFRNSRNREAYSVKLATCKDNIEGITIFIAANYENHFLSSG